MQKIGWYRGVLFVPCSFYKGCFLFAVRVKRKPYYPSVSLTLDSFPFRSAENPQSYLQFPRDDVGCGLPVATSAEQRHRPSGAKSHARRKKSN